MINEVIAKFVIKFLHISSGETGYESLNEMIQALYANAVAIPSTLSGKKHGHIGLIIKYT